eukprot:COSAG06_NODE_70528_length_191_cov_70.586957_1_plen_33_part_01
MMVRGGSRNAKAAAAVLSPTRTTQQGKKTRAKG